MIKRYTPGIEQSHPELEAVAFMMEAKHGECVMYADHAAFVAKVREIAERMEHDLPCSVARSNAAWSNQPKPDCTCPRGQLLEVSNG